MAKVVVFNSVDEYIAAQPGSAQPALRLVRETIRKAVPGAEESISYNMPTYKLEAAQLLHFAAWKAHFSLYAASKSLLAEFKDELRPYVVEKGTIRFPLDEPVPEKLIERIAEFRAREIANNG
ncbi:MAG: DUF1801 domain-containing protein [Candidatus Eremiobacteraeota bacterium]|nr:DUF1801 domain-containing protein [Candidatus Eremiobacteraeota bacterium]